MSSSEKKLNEVIETNNEIKSNEQTNNESEKEETNTCSKKNFFCKSKLELLSIRFRWLIFGIVIGAILCFMFYARIRKDVQNIHNVNSTTINIDYLTGRIKNMSDLITADLQYSGLVRYATNEDKWNSFFTSEEFLMTFKADVRAGIDLSLVKISEFMGKYKVTIPHATIKYNKVDPKSINFYNVKNPLLKGDDKIATQESIIEAENDVLKNGNIQLLIDNAEQQAENLISGLIEELIGDNEITFEYFDTQQSSITDNSIEINNNNSNDEVENSEIESE